MPAQRDGSSSKQLKKESQALADFSIVGALSSLQETSSFCNEPAADRPVSIHRRSERVALENLYLMQLHVAKP